MAENESDSESAEGKRRGDSRGRWLRAVLLLLGLVLLAITLKSVDLSQLLDETRELGWRLFIIAVLPATMMHFGFFSGWALALRQRVPLRPFLGAYLAGEAVNVLTGLAQMGGEPLKASLMRSQLGGERAVASVVGARTLRTIALLVFIAVGLGIAARGDVLPVSWTRWLWFGLGLLIVGVGLFFWIQRRGLLSRLVRRSSGSRGQRVAALAVSLERIEGALRESYGSGVARVGLSVGVQLAAFLVSALEVYLLCLWVGSPVSLVNAIMLEAISMGLTTILFFIPAGIGVNEGGRAALFELAGLGSPLGLLSGVVRRAREVLVSLLALAAAALLLRQQMWSRRQRGALEESSSEDLTC